MMPLVMVGLDAFWLVTHMYEFYSLLLSSHYSGLEDSCGDAEHSSKKGNHS